MIPASVLAPIAIKLGGKLVGSVLRSKNLGQVADVLDVLGNVFGVDPTPEAIKAGMESAPDAETRMADAEAQAAAMVPVWTLEAQRASEAQTAELSQGFGAWQFWKGVIQAVVWAGWLAILACALFGGNMGVKTLMPIGDLVSTWGSVTMAWLVVYNGGHTIKEVVAGGAFNWRGK